MLTNSLASTRHRYSSAALKYDPSDVGIPIGFAPESVTLAVNRQIERHKIDSQVKANGNLLEARSVATDQSEQGGIGDCDKIIDIPSLFSVAEISGWSVRTLQEWEGFIESVNNEGFEATMRDLTDARAPKTFAQIPFTEIDSADMHKVRPGALFHLVIGYFNRGNGQRRGTVIYFREITSNVRNDARQLAEML